ncbi:hypothetical protein [Neisseria chenwenguii]|uniref:Uncharacterized protein n=1 Tax=Neisseria chenwenguii TaxID=1853278 RepID=A0A220S2R6_9NEIS|nr:hypothetical protein [Neisseria chenwenguii]ASK27485.1 hypothetical protein BG910_06765 [Neisseria chenwenguii]ROV54071.1 hypothetical protein EGS38_11495 [Neisseria chenwenguii]
MDKKVPVAVPAVSGVLSLLLGVIPPEYWTRQYDHLASLVFGSAIGGGLPWINKICKGLLAGEHRFSRTERLMFAVALFVVGNGVVIITRPQVFNELTDKTALLAFAVTSWFCAICIRAQESVARQEKTAVLEARIRCLEEENRNL